MPEGPRGLHSQDNVGQALPVAPRGAVGEHARQEATHGARLLHASCFSVGRLALQAGLELHLGIGAEADPHLCFLPWAAVRTRGPVLLSAVSPGLSNLILPAAGLRCPGLSL